jgi:hypothetical protein
MPIPSYYPLYLIYSSIRLLKLFIYSGYKSLIRYTSCQNFISFCGIFTCNIKFLILLTSNVPAFFLLPFCFFMFYSWLFLTPPNKKNWGGAVLGFELRFSHLISRHFTTWTTPLVLQKFIFMLPFKSFIDLCLTFGSMIYFE